MLNVSNTAIPPPPPIPWGQACTFHLFTPSHLPCLQSLSFNPYHIGNLFWKVTHTFCIIFLVCFLYIMLHQDISIPKGIRIWQFLILDLNFITLSMCHLSKLFINSSEISFPYTQPWKEVWEQARATVTLPGWWILQANELRSDNDKINMVQWNWRIRLWVTLCSSRKYPYSPHRRDWNFRGGGGFCKTKKFKEMCEALLEFPEGWRGLRKYPFRGGGMDIFWNYTLLVLVLREWC